MPTAVHCILDADVDFDVLANRIVKKTAECGECIVWTGTKQNGYGIIWYSGTRYRVHRAVYEITRSRLPSDHVVRHTCDNPACVRLDHLQSGTHAENMQDIADHGKRNYGEDCGSSKLTEPQVRALWKLRSLGTPVAEVAKQFNISISEVCHIANRKRWLHLNLPPLNLPKGPTGEAHGMSKTTVEDVIEIRRRAPTGESYASLGRAFGLSDTTVSGIVKRRSWKHVK